ncbi:MAG: hypothetical protein IT376_00785 [Polyangiaceae bacterium]|nr:hypothetical protein [Polyangiaceae bacterium]
MSSPRPHLAARALARTLRVAPLIVAPLIVALATSSARAEPSQAELARARQLFREATAAEAAKEWAVAIAKLRTALGLKETPGLRYHLGFCLEESGELLAALVEYARARALVSGGTAAPDVEPLLGPALERIVERIPTLTVELPPGAGEARVTVDGAEIAAGRPERMAPGRHAVEVTAPGRKPDTRTVELAERQRLVWTPELPPAAAPTSPSPASPSPAPATQPDSLGANPRRFGTREWVLASEATMTLVGLVGGVYYLSRAATAGDDAERASAGIDAVSAAGGGDECSSGTFSRRDLCVALADSLDARDRARTWATGSLVVAGVGALAFTGTWLLWARPGERGAYLEPAAATLDRGGYWAGVRGRF